MTNERAIELLHRISDSQFDSIHGDERREALSMAVRALEGDGDTISRKMAIDALEGVGWYHINKTTGKMVHGSTSDMESWCKVDDVRKAIEKLSSAQSEVIRCTECKHYREYDSEYVENAVVVQCMADRYPISETIPDGWFCAGAERKDNG